MAVEDGERRDLPALLVPLMRALMAAEGPVLAKYDLSMWAYAVLTGLDGRPARTQAALAEAIGADKTRIIGVLDELQARGLILREPDPADRRARVLSLTDEGRRIFHELRTVIQAGENELLARLPAADRRGFLRGLTQLCAIAERGEVPGASPGEADHIA